MLYRSSIMTDISTYNNVYLSAKTVNKDSM